MSTRPNACDEPASQTSVTKKKSLAASSVFSSVPGHAPPHAGLFYLFTKGKAHQALNDDIFAEFGDVLFDIIADTDRWVFDKFLP